MTVAFATLSVVAMLAARSAETIPPFTAAVVILLLVMVALAGVTSPLRRRDLVPIDPPADPLEDRRLALLIALRDLETAWASGAIEERDYQRLRTETESRMARVLRALDERAGPVEGDQGEGVARPRRRTSLGLVAAAVVGAMLLGVVTPALLRSLKQRPAEAAVAVDSLTFFEQRVRQHPRDLAARLDLASRYLNLGQLTPAYKQYLAALDIDHHSTDALAHVGILLHLEGRPKAGLDAENQALALDPTNAEALFFKGVILLKGLERPAPAAEALQAYLDAAPFGPEVPEARQLLQEARLAARP
jgi:tetratricopeptide (TPR) repeat protein